MRAIYINPISDLITDKKQVHHLVNVLRVKTEEKVYLFDGSGVYCKAIIKKTSKKSIELNLEEKETYQSGHNIELAMSWIKKDAFEDALNTAVQIGISKIHLFKSDYSQKTHDLSKERFEKILISATEQSNHFIIPKLVEYESIQEAYSKIEDAQHICFSLKNMNDGEQKNEPASKIVYWIGPEGGFSESEVNYFLAKGMNFFQIPVPIMRAQVAVSCALGYILGKLS